MKRIKLILSCDTKNEIDDQFAIFYALKSPEIDLLGVVSVQNNRKSGRNCVDSYHEEAKKIVRLAKSKVPCFKGSRRPIDIDHPETSAGVKFIIEKIKHSREQIIVASTGPATDLATALILEPKIVKKANFIWLGGFKNAAEARKLRNREGNYQGDPKAAEILLNSKAEIVLIPAWGVADGLVINSQILAEKLRSQKTPIADYLADLLEFNWQRYGPVHHFIPKVLKRFWVMFDLAVVAAAKNYAIEHTTKKSPNFRKIEKIDPHKILAQFEKYILTC